MCFLVDNILPGIHIFSIWMRLNFWLSLNFKIVIFPLSSENKEIKREKDDPEAQDITPYLRADLLAYSRDVRDLLLHIYQRRAGAFAAAGDSDL